MKIAQVAPLAESVPPRLYGGTERVVSFLTEELVRLGHDVTLFASGDSRTNASLVPCCRTALRLDPSCRDPLSLQVLEIERVASMARHFDVIHFHIAPLHLPIARRLPHAAHLTTLHGRLDLPELADLFAEYRDVPVVSISDAQRTPLPGANWVGTVYHGLPPALLPYRETPEDYLVFVGRISPEKRVDRAIAIATAAGMRLRIAAKVDPVDREYFEREIRHLLDHPLVDYVGEIGDREKAAFIGGARALLFPIDWPEPFGIVMIEALSCGVPVIAFRGGSVDEVIEDGVTGFVVESIDEAVDAVRRLDTISRRTCRDVFERRFTARRMAMQYVQLYARLAARPTGLVA